MSVKKDFKDLKYWCALKSSDNKSRNGKWQGECVGCCLFCKERVCPLVTCTGFSQGDLCAWKRSPVEWLLGRISNKAAGENYVRRKVEYYLRIGHKTGENSWIGGFLARMKKLHGEDFGEVQEGLE